MRSKAIFEGIGFSCLGRKKATSGKTSDFGFSGLKHCHRQRRGPREDLPSGGGSRRRKPPGGGGAPGGLGGGRRGPVSNLRGRQRRLPEITQKTQGKEAARALQSLPGDRRLPGR
ncbi:MAG: hypothetical protein AMJ41_02205 [candidate division Zixibacteria bacterium DG_27]|nr:MAG: hypothetical protein AMJ41_02205 [candidate division Zixibacteria bacterium DG_27]